MSPRVSRRAFVIPVAAMILVALLLAVGCGQEESQQSEETAPGGGEATSSGGSASGGGATASEETTAAGGSASGGGTTSGGSDSGGGSASGGEGSLVVYSGRNEELVGPIIERFEQESGIDVEVRYGDTAELASTILEEGENSPADVFFSQDAGALGALADAGRLEALPEDELNLVNERFRDPDGRWVGVSGRARVVAYNTEALSEEELPGSILEFAEPEWEGRIGWPPTNASFQAFVTALRATEGEEVAREWLEGVQANGARKYDNNLAVLEAVASGEVEVGFVNHYYLFQKIEEEGEDFGARNHYLENGDPGALVNAAGIGLLEGSDGGAEAEQFVEFMLSEEAQRYFADETFEYPLIEGVPVNEELAPLSEIETPEIDLGDLDDLEGTLDLLRETGVL